MAEVKDIIFESDDLVIFNGDLKVIESDQMHIEHILRAEKGHFREQPLLGVGIENNLNGPISQSQLKQDIKIQLIKDNYAVKQILVNEEFEISVNATRKL